MLHTLLKEHNALEGCVKIINRAQLSCVKAMLRREADRQHNDAMELHG